MTRRMALLYCAKLNSDAFKGFVNESGKAWATFFTDAGSYSLQPNQPFELDTFVRLPDDVIRDYCDNVCNAFSRHKVRKGVTYRYAPREMHVVQFDEMMDLLSQDSTPEAQSHMKRQALLLSDIAGFD